MDHKKKRVQGDYRISARQADLDAASIAAAFTPTKELVCAPLLEAVLESPRVAMVKVQYEPPNSGGGRGDLDKLVLRAARHLDAGAERLSFGSAGRCVWGEPVDLEVPATKTRTAKPGTARRPSVPAFVFPKNPAKASVFKKRNVLIINSYAGSLTIGAKNYGQLPISGSYEDSAYGLEMQHANFPDLDYRPMRADWPADVDLSKTIVLAHPPCSAFSNMTPKNAGRTGLDSEAFACTRQVLDYAMGRKAAAIAIESVPRALEGAEAVHLHYAAQHGYKLSRILQNAVSFGVPQWRSRFWAVFFREDLAPKRAAWRVPKPAAFTRLRDVLDDISPGAVPKELAAWVAKQTQKLRDLEFTDQQIDEVYGTPGMLSRTINRLHCPDLDLKEAHDKYVGKGIYFSHALRVLDPDNFATVLLGNSSWLYRGQPVGENWFRLIMGFPVDYKMPTAPSQHDLRTYLSKGVCPPVAEWVLDSVVRNLDGEIPPGAVLLPHGDVADLQAKRAEAIVAAVDE